MKVLVTGGAGFIGSATVKELLKRGHEVLVYDIKDPNPNHIQDYNYSYIQGDIRDLSHVRKVMKGCDAVIHLAAMVSVPDAERDPTECMDINDMGTHNVLWAVTENPQIRKVVFASSAAVYGEHTTEEVWDVYPKSQYGFSKVAGEIYCRSPKLVGKVQVLRYFNVYGSDLSKPNVIASMIRTIKSGQPITIYGDGLQTRSFVHVEDLAKVNVDIAVGSIDVLDRSRPCNVAGKEVVSIMEIAQAICAHYGLDFDRSCLFMPDRPGDIKHSVASINNGIEYLHFMRPFSEGLQQVLKDVG